MLYPKIKPYNEFYLKVSDMHTIFVEESGNPKGKPVIFLHGGPGGGIEPIYRQYFNSKGKLIRNLIDKGDGNQNNKSDAYLDNLHYCQDLLLEL